MSTPDHGQERTFKGAELIAAFGPFKHAIADGHAYTESEIRSAFGEDGEAFLSARPAPRVDRSAGNLDPESNPLIPGGMAGRAAEAAFDSARHLSASSNPLIPGQARRPADPAMDPARNGLIPGGQMSRALQNVADMAGPCGNLGKATNPLIPR